MKFAFAYLGVPNEIYDSVVKEQKFISGTNTFAHFVPHGPNEQLYRQHEVDRTLNAFLPYVQQEKEKETGDVGFAVFYVGKPGDNLIRQKLFPYLLTVKIDWELNIADKISIQQSKNVLVKRLNEAGPIVRRALDAIRRDLEENRQRTPWLLPVRNFRSKHLSGAILALQDAAIATELDVKMMSRLSDQFRRHHPMQRTQEGNGTGRRYFVDDSGLQFKPPGLDLHGFHKPTSGHNNICEISSRRRLGAPYHRAFHFDCSRGNGSTSARLDSCHSENPAMVASEKHINIAPNDYTRPEATN